MSVLEGPFTAVYVTSIVTVLVGFRRTIRQRDPLLLYLALAFLAGSVGVDLLQERLGDHQYRVFVEDGSKFLGITGVCTYHLRQAW